ncbi:MAG TPA: hypothetical protein PLV68_18650, partial [Ilumatobacteraceae bacterium]|nr:hypothetical protein [Ilumatobacteraceae bacterium]
MIAALTLTHWAVVTAVATVAGVVGLQVAIRFNARSATLAARRRTGLMQLGRWGLLSAGVSALAVEGAVAAGVSSAWTGAAALAFVSCVALAAREP